MKQKVIFIPGLGDAKHGGLERLLKFSFYRVDLCYLPLIWADGDFKPKLDLLLDKIDKLAEQNSRVSLLGTSAGASAVINAYVQRRSKVDKVVLVCGKLRERYNYKSPAFKNNPAFEQSMRQLEDNLVKLTDDDKKRFFLLYSPGDNTVPPIDAKLGGAKTNLLPRLNHVTAFFYALIFRAKRIQNFIKQT